MPSRSNILATAIWLLAIGSTVFGPQTPPPFPQEVEPVMLEILLEGIRALRDGRLEATPQARDAGRQYFVLHPRLYERARAR